MRGGGRVGTVPGVLALVGAVASKQFSPGAALLEEMLAGWRNQQQARRLTVRLIGERERVVRQFGEFTGCWPWQWSAAQADAWVASGGGRIRRSGPIRGRWRCSWITC